MLRQKAIGLGFKEVRVLVLGWVGGDRMVSHSPTLVFCGESRRDSQVPPPGQKLPRGNASRMQFRAACMHVVKLKRVALQP
jgi:hypothetical protein